MPAPHVRIAYMDGTEKEVLCTISYSSDPKYDMKYVFDELNKYFVQGSAFPLEDRLSRYIRDCAQRVYISRPNNYHKGYLYEVLVDSSNLANVQLKKVK